MFKLMVEKILTNLCPKYLLIWTIGTFIIKKIETFFFWVRNKKIIFLVCSLIISELKACSSVTATDEKKKEGFVRVIVAVKNLDTSSQLIRKGFLPKTVKKASNAKVDAVFENQ